METKIWVYDKPHNIKPTDTIRSTRRLTSFCFFNCLRDAIVKSQGGWYLITLEGQMQFIDRCLDNITFEQVYNLLKKD
jgi:hypothetical protein